MSYGKSIKTRKRSGIKEERINLKPLEFNAHCNRFLESRGLVASNAMGQAAKYIKARKERESLEGIE